MSDRLLKGALAEMKQQLLSFSACLGREKVLADTAFVFDVLESLGEGKPTAGSLPWRYSLSKIELKLNALGVRWPEDPTAFICTFDLTVKGRVRLAGAAEKPGRKKAVVAAQRKEWEDFVVPSGAPCWRIDELACDMQLLAHACGSPKWQQFWHFDRHVAPDGKDPKPAEVHPLFHFHFGGDALATGRQGNDKAWGNLLELHAPRIAHPPMDLVLLIDFLLANFSGQVRQELVANHKDYQDVIQAAQRRFWCPYNTALGDYFNVGRNEQASHWARELWPSLDCVAS